MQLTAGFLEKLRTTPDGDGSLLDHAIVMHGGGMSNPNEHSYIGLPIVGSQHHDWLHQVETTRNLELPRFVSFFFIGLDYQVEHHLFPKIPHQHLPRAAAITPS